MRSSRTLAAVTLIVTATIAAGCAASPPVTGQFVERWLDKMYALVRLERLAPTLAARVYAYGAVALYEGLAPGSPELRSLAGQLNGLGELPRPEAGGRYDWPMVAARAEVVVLKEMFSGGFPATITAIEELGDSLIGARFAEGVAAAVRDRSLAYGETLGNAIVAWANADGFLETRTRPYAIPVGRGYWVPTGTAEEFRAISLSRATDLVQLEDPVSRLNAATASERMLLANRPKGPGSERVATAHPLRPSEPYWATLRPFVMNASDECRPPAPVAYSEARGSGFYEQAMAVHRALSDSVDVRKNTALYWDDSPGKTGTPAGHWAGIMSNVAEQQSLDGYRAAEVYALLSIAVADAFISCWDEKFRSLVVRPVTYIRKFIDADWDAFLVTPPFPEYSSGHSVQSAAAATVLETMLGDSMPFVDDIHLSIGQAPRRFPSFRAAANEAATSRLYGGIHYAMAIENGITQGNCVGQKVLERVRTR